MVNTEWRWMCRISLQVPLLWPVQSQNTPRPDATGSSRILFIYLFFQDKALGLWYCPPDAQRWLRHPLRTGSSIRILLLPRPCRDLVVNLQSRSPVYHPPTQVLPSGRGHICSRLVCSLLVTHRLLLWRWCMYIRVITSVLVATVAGFPKYGWRMLKASPEAWRLTENPCVMEWQTFTHKKNLIHKVRLHDDSSFVQCSQRWMISR